MIFYKIRDFRHDGIERNLDFEEKMYNVNDFINLNLWFAKQKFSKSYSLQGRVFVPVLVLIVMILCTICEDEECIVLLYPSPRRIYCRFDCGIGVTCIITLRTYLRWSLKDSLFKLGILIDSPFLYGISNF